MIPFNKPYISNKVLCNIEKVCDNECLGKDIFVKKCEAKLRKITSSKRALLTHSCTGALEISAILANIKDGDEVIMSSFTHPSTANAFVLRGGVPVFVDIREDTLNIDETLILSAWTPKTKAIVVTHYAGIACEMDTIIKLANKCGIIVVEDAAQCIDSYYRGDHLGSMGDFGTISFHSTKNIPIGEGGVLLINNSNYIDRAEIVHKFGTNRTKFMDNKADKYEWVDIGSSYMTSEITAAFLYSQLSNMDSVTKQRLNIWDRYLSGFEDLEKEGYIKRPTVPRECWNHNAHIFYLLVWGGKRDFLLNELAKRKIQSSTHFVPLHTSKYGKKFYKYLPVTNVVSNCILRLPIWYNMPNNTVDYIIDNVKEVIHSVY